VPVWAVTGKLGAGKTLVAVSRIQKYLNANRRVATNLDLKLENLISIHAKKTECFRLPDVPTLESLEGIGLGYDGAFIGDERNGLVVMDECAKWLNSRDWNDKSRKALINYFVHLRKKRWDLILIIQDINALDKQFRDLYCEHVVYCSRSDRYGIPFIGPVLKLFWGEKIPLPRVHIGNVYYCIGTKENHVENWIYRGNSIMEAYDTEQGFNESTSPMLYQYLPPYLISGRYQQKYDELKKVIKSFKVSHFFFIGLLLGGFAIKAMEPDGNNPDRGNWTCNDDWKLLFGSCDLTKADVKKMISQYTSSSVVKAAPDLSGKGQTKDVPPIDYVYISGSVESSDGFDYLFNGAGDVPFYPAAHGYTVRWGGVCKAFLISLNKQKTITCNPSIFPNENI
jgi:hypothetical protein